MLFLFRRVYWITRTPAFIWVGLGCIWWTVSSQLIIFVNLQTHINSNNLLHTKERSGRSRHLFSFYWPAQNALVNKKIVSLKRRIPSWGFSCSSQLPKSCGLLCFAFYYMSFYLYNSFCYNRLESQSIMSLQGRRNFLKSGGEASTNVMSIICPPWFK